MVMNCGNAHVFYRWFGLHVRLQVYRSRVPGRQGHGRMVVLMHGHHLVVLLHFLLVLILLEHLLQLVEELVLLFLQGLHLRLEFSQLGKLWTYACALGMESNLIHPPALWSAPGSCCFPLLSFYASPVPSSDALQLCLALVQLGGSRKCI